MPRFPSARRWRALLAAPALLALAACLGAPTEPELQVYGTGPRILFIGNSNTYYHDMPGLVQGLAASRGRSLAIAMVAFPDFSLADHWASRPARSAIALGGWEVVVLQQGPSALPESREVLRTMTRLFTGEIRAGGARPALYAAWPQAQHLADFAASAESYRLAAEDVDGLLMPASTAWRAAWERDPALALYSDGVHASTTGAYLAALVIYARITGESPVGLPTSVTTHRGYRIDVGTETALLLQEAAAAALSSKPVTPAP